MNEIHSIDLQIQTTASDGKHSPAECVRMAKANGVHTVAITDHDTVAGVAEAVAAGAELGVRVIPGIELSLQDHGMHLLGLGIDVANRHLLRVLEKASANRMAAAQEMVGRFQKGGFVVEWSDVLAEAGRSAVVTRPHIVSAIMKRPENRGKLEGIATKYEFFQRYFTDTSPYYVRASPLGAREGIALVHGAGGVAVWSHPPIPDFVGNCAGLGEFLQELVAAKIDGLELFGSSLTANDFACLDGLRWRHHLLATAGSDFHEAQPPTADPWPRSAAAIGEFPTFGRSLDGILPALDAALERRAVARGS